MLAVCSVHKWTVCIPCMHACIFWCDSTCNNQRLCSLGLYIVNGVYRNAFTMAWSATSADLLPAEQSVWSHGLFWLHLCLYQVCTMQSAAHLSQLHTSPKAGTWLLSCCRKQALLIKLGDSAGPLAGFSLRLIPTITADTLPLSKLTPERCNLRPATPTAAAPAATAVAGSDNNIPLGKKRKRPEQDAKAANAKKTALEGATGTASADNKASTPLYSASIVADVMTEQHQQVQQAAFEAMPRLSQAVVLLKVGFLTCTCCSMPASFGTRFCKGCAYSAVLCPDSCGTSVCTAHAHNAVSGPECGLDSNLIYYSWQWEVLQMWLLTTRSVSTQASWESYRATVAAGCACTWRHT